ncbi:heavy-metal-associated domain-containing protein [Chloroflexia bacterium SDU3-3]|nr:heavy-metal-associated domain-containing protein [Chloroflexia bacterium SDU3-3]
MSKDQFRVPDISCQHCVNAITNEVKTLPGIQKIDISLDDKLVTIEHDSQVDSAAIVAAINEAGYDEVQPVAA